jgi:hypothetical protein
MTCDEEELERRLDFIVRELDEFVVMTANRDTYPLIAREAIALGQIQTRVQLVLSYIANHQPVKFRIIKHG